MKELESGPFGKFFIVLLRHRHTSVLVFLHSSGDSIVAAIFGALCNAGCLPYTASLLPHFIACGHESAPRAVDHRSKAKGISAT